jgi:hypothetical protein
MTRDLQIDKRLIRDKQKFISEFTYISIEIAQKLEIFSNRFIRISQMLQDLLATEAEIEKQQKEASAKTPILPDLHLLETDKKMGSLSSIKSVKLSRFPQVSIFLPKYLISLF